MNRISSAIDHYHNLLQERHLESTVSILDSVQEKLSVASRPVCAVLRPFFIEEATYQFVKNASTLVMRGISKLSRHLLADSKLRRQMDLAADEEEIIQIDTGYGLPDVSARLDGFLSHQGAFQFVEYNADSPGGIGYGDALGDLFASMPVVQEFAKRYRFRTVGVRDMTVHALLQAYFRWGGKRLPAIAIIDWKDASTRAEFLLFQEYFEKHGCRARIGDPRDLEYRNGKLFLGDFQIDLVYKRLVVGELLRRLGLKHALLRAARDGAVCVANGFGIQLAFHKTLFALLSDPEYSHIIGEDAAAAVARHVPWTRRVSECKTLYRGKTIDLLPMITSNKDSFVLKPGGDYGGRGVVLGWQSTDAEWSSAIHAALDSSYVVQERVDVGSEMYPSFENGHLVFQKRYFDLDPYVWNGETIEGCGVRLSQAALLNVSAGGGSATPMFILKK
jgi:hypothetical protein